ncbi:hypothetical protein LTR08_002962 [Meristemomyces frigidus]|nr:hypothetical protein LTR08_002962 [Meristemomyces frigidus]
MHFARNRADFETYMPLDTTATAADGNREVQVFGIGTVKIAVKRQLYQHATLDFTLSDCLHIPAARCNGLSLSRMEDLHLTFTVRKDSYFTLLDPTSNASLWCGNNASGRDRMYLAGEKMDVNPPRHITCDSLISISADRGEIAAQQDFAKLSRDGLLQDHHVLPTSDDWIIHDGNVDFARSRAAFHTYTAVDGYALSGNGLQRLPVIGIGWVKIPIDLPYGYTPPIAVPNVLHIPSARCNGLSHDLLEKADCVSTMPDPEDGAFVIVDYNNEVVGGLDKMHGSAASGREVVRVEDSPTWATPASRHATIQGSISISASQTQFAPWRSGPQEPTK